MKDLFRLGVRAAVAAIARGEFSCADYARSCLARIAEKENEIGAWAWLDDKRALGLARAADEESGAHSPMRGIPLGIKDIIDVAGLPTAMGSPVCRDKIAPESAQVVRKLERAGAFAMGKAVTAEFAFLAPGKTRNPWNTAHTPGGSSMGSAAAVAAGFVPAALGTQTNGSIVRPAAFCGVVGFKPSLGALSSHGTLDYSPTLDQTGVFARSVQDAALVAACAADASLAREVAALNEPPRLAAVRSPVWGMTEEAQRASFGAAVKNLHAAGADVVETELPAAFHQAHPCLRKIMAYEAARFFRELQRRHRPVLSRELNEFLDEGARLDEDVYREALAFRIELQQALAGYLSAFDAIVTPPAAGEAPATLAHTGNPALCTIWTLCGVPAVSIPVGLGPGGLPLGLQIVGRLREDDALLQAAAWCESQLPFRGLRFQAPGK